MGQFAKVCRSTRKQEIREIEVPELTVLYMTSTSPAPNKILCDVKMSSLSGATMQELIVDTGSSVSLLSEGIYKQYFSDLPGCASCHIFQE